MSDHKIIVEVYGIREAEMGDGCDCDADSDSIPASGAACALPMAGTSQACCEPAKTVEAAFEDVVQALGKSDIADKVELKFYDLIMDDFDNYDTVKELMDQGHPIPMTAVERKFLFFGDIDSEMIYAAVQEALKNKEDIREYVRNNYAEVAQKGTAGGCCNIGAAPFNISEMTKKIGYTEADSLNVPPEANMGLGCGNPIAIAALKDGEVVLDLGSGGGFDCFLARRQVGETGYVIGVDMTPDMITLARKNAEKSGYTNVEFRLGEIEHLPVADSSVDVLISNCVINLSPDKQQVYNEVFRVLKPGGRLSISDVVATAQIPQEIKQDLALISCCIGGAEYIDDIRAMLQHAGFSDIQIKPKDNSKDIVSAWAPDKNVDEFVASCTIEAKKEDK